MQNLREYALGSIVHALRLELADDYSAELIQRGQALVAIAEESNIEVDTLLRWIHTQAPGKEWSAREFRGWCAEYVALREKLAGNQAAAAAGTA